MLVLVAVVAAVVADVKSVEIKEGEADRGWPSSRSKLALPPLAKNSRRWRSSWAASSALERAGSGRAFSPGGEDGGVRVMVFGWRVFRGLGTWRGERRLLNLRIAFI